MDPTSLQVTFSEADPYIFDCLPTPPVLNSDGPARLQMPIRWW